MILHCHLHLPIYFKGYLLSLKSVSKSLRPWHAKDLPALFVLHLAKRRPVVFYQLLHHLIYRLQLAKL